MSLSPEPIVDIAHLDHVELLTPRPDESLWFFTEVMGLDVVHRQGRSVYLRCYQDYQRFSLKLTEARRPGVGVVSWRAMSPKALERRARAIADSGQGGRWTNGDYGIGRTYRFEEPDGHKMEVFFEQEPFDPTPTTRSALKNQPSRFSGRGIGVKRIDHLALLCGDVAKSRRFMQDVLGFRVREQVIFNRGKTEIGSWMAVTNVHHNCAFVTDIRSGGRPSGRLHHYGMWVDNRDEVLRAADIYRENGIFIEAGPSRHNLSQAFYLYAYEPGGNRVEVYSSSYLIFAPDYRPITWNESEREGGIYWGARLPPSFLGYATPPVPLNAEKAALAREIPIIDPQ